MAQLYCPLCKQEVSKVLYEKITGVWQEKEKVLAVLKNKGKQLLNREKQLHVRFESEKKKIVGREQAILKRELSKQQQSFRAAIKKGKDAIKKEKQAVEKKFEKRLASETNRILKEGKRHQKQLELSLKQKFKLSAEQALSRERKIISKDKATLERKERIQLDKNRKLNQQFISFQSKSKKTLGQQDKKIALLKEQL